MFMPGRMRNIEGRRLNHGSYFPEEPKTEKELEPLKEQGTTSTPNKSGKEAERDAV